MPYPKQKHQKGPLIYMLTFPNGKRYIGQTVNSFETRMVKHKSASKHRLMEGCVILNQAINKYGWNNIAKEVLLFCDVKTIDNFESKLINLYDTIEPNGYNLLSGGNSNKAMTSSMKTKTSVAHIRNSMKKHPERVRYGCIYKHKVREISMSDKINIKHSIIDHPLCEFKSFDKYDDAVDYLTDLNIDAYRKKIDVSEHEIGVGLEYSSVNTYAEIKDTLNSIVFQIMDNNRYVDRYKRIANANNKNNINNKEKGSET